MRKAIDGATLIKGKLVRGWVRVMHMVQKMPRKGFAVIQEY